MYVMHLWDMHNRTTEEQARKNRGRINNGKISEMENPAAPNDGRYDMDVHGDTVVVPKPTPEAMTTQAASLTATVTGAMTGAFAVWLGHEK